MDSMKSQNSVVISINDILDELMDENKRLFNELLFANKLLNELKSNLNLNYNKFETIIDFEDKLVFNRLIRELNEWRDKTSLEVSGSASDEQIRVDSNVIKQESIDTKSSLIGKKNVKKRCKTIIESNARRSSRSERKDYIIGPKHTKDPNRVPKPKRVAKVYEIPDPQSDPNSLLLLRRNNYDDKTGQFLCPNPSCGKGFRSSRRLYHHFHLCHHSKKTIICQHLNCGKRFKTNNELKIHQRVHSNDRPYECPREGCSYRCKANSMLNNHMISHSDLKPYKCDVCNNTFKTVIQMNVHKKTHNKIPNIQYSCRWEGCQQLFVSKERLRLHRIEAHNGKALPIHRCEWPGCDYTTKRPEKLREHRTLHTGERAYECLWPDCGKRFRVKDSLRLHAMDHTNLKPYKCPWPACEFRCKDTKYVTQHLRVTHKYVQNKTSNTT